jgi:hypothetical protein
MGPALRCTECVSIDSFSARLHTHAARCTLPRILLEVRRAHVLSQPWAMSPCTRGTHIQKAIADSVVFRAARGLQCRVCAARSRALVASRGSDCWRAPETRLAGKPASPVASPPAPAL